MKQKSGTPAARCAQPLMPTAHANRLEFYLLQSYPASPPPGADEMSDEWRSEAEMQSLSEEEGDELTEQLCSSTEPALGASSSSSSSASTMPSGAVAVDEPALSAALILLEQQRASGAPLDVLLSRHVRANGLGQQARSLISGYLDTVSRCHGRLESRLQTAGVTSEPRSRLLASICLCTGAKPSDIPNLSAEESEWLDALAAPLEAEAVPMEEAARLECPPWAWPSFQAAFGHGEAAAGGSGGAGSGGGGGGGGASASPQVAVEMRALQSGAPLDLRVNTLKASREEALSAIRRAGFGAKPTPYSPVGIRLEERAVPLGQIPGLLEGVVDPQDEGSQLVALLLGAQPGERVVDYCAGAGGKTLALAAEMSNKGKLFAMDIDEGRLGRGASRHAKAGVDNVERHVIESGPTDKWLKRRKRSFDRVLVDAPCSGVGAWRRNPDARWLRKTRPLCELLPIQAEVLQRAARLVRPGGTLVYATCSMLQEENDEQVAAFLDSNDGADFQLSRPVDFPVPLEEESGYMRLTPARHGTDGFFGAVLMRKEGGWSRASRKAGRKRENRDA